MGRPDRERIVTLVGEARRALGQLHKHAAETEEDLLASEVKLGNIKYQFIVAIESCIDICAHIAAKSYARAPESYAACFDILVEENVVERELASRMSELARFRNVLVHRYWEVNDQRVVGKLRTDLQHVEEFLRKAAALVQ